MFENPQAANIIFLCEPPFCMMLFYCTHNIEEIFVLSVFYKPTHSLLKQTKV